jgi:drug/metabolite transporter (DMT)-like permease
MAREERLNNTAPASIATQAAARLYQWPSVLLTLTAIFWAGNAVASRLAVGQIAPMQLVCLRWVMVLAVMWPLYGAQVRAHWGEVRPQLGRIIVVGFLGLTAFNALFYVAAHTTTAVNIGILQGSVPVIVLAGAFLTYGTKATLVQIAGVLITAAGVVVVATHGRPLSILDIDFNRGDLLMLTACVLYAIYTVALRDRPKMPGAAFFTLLALISAVTSLPLAAAEAAVSGWSWPTWQGWLVTLYVAIFPSTLAQVFFVRAVDLIGPGRTGVFVNLVPIFAAILAVALIGEPFAAFHAIALALVLGGIWLAQRTR